MIRKLFLLALLPPMLVGQAKSEDNELVYVPRKYVSSEGMNHQAEVPKPTAPETASKWVGVGREVSLMVKESLNAVLVEADKFGASRVGTYVMLLIAWRMMGKELLGVALGLPFFAVCMSLWVWSYRRLFISRRVLVKKEGRLKTWEIVAPPDFDCSSNREWTVAFHVVFLLFILIVGCCVVF